MCGRDGFTWFVHNSTNIVSRNVNIRTSITEFDGGGGNTYDGVNVVRREMATEVDGVSDGGGEGGVAPLPLVACNADVFHSSGCRHGPRVVNSEYSFAFDDYVNVHTRAQVSIGLWVEDDKEEKKTETTTMTRVAL